MLFQQNYITYHSKLMLVFNLLILWFRLFLLHESLLFKTCIYKNLRI